MIAGPWGGGRRRPLARIRRSSSTTRDQRGPSSRVPTEARQTPTSSTGSHVSRRVSAGPSVVRRQRARSSSSTPEPPGSSTRASRLRDLRASCSGSPVAVVIAGPSARTTRQMTLRHRASSSAMTAQRGSRSRVPNPIGGADGQNDLYSVTCDTGNECWAVGHSDYYLGADYGWSLIERYTASTGWTTDGPDPALSGEQFFGVACAALECTAVGGNSVDIEPAIAQSPVTMASVGGGGSSGTSGPPASGATGSTGSAGPGVPDTGGAGTPWAPLLIAGGVVAVARARRVRSMSIADKN